MSLNLIQERSDWKAILTLRNLSLYIICLVLAGFNIYIVIFDIFTNFALSAGFSFISQTLVAVVFIYLMIIKPIHKSRKAEEILRKKHL